MYQPCLFELNIHSTKGTPSKQVYFGCVYVMTPCVKGTTIKMLCALGMC